MPLQNAVNGSLLTKLVKWKIFTAASLRKNLSLSLNIMQLDQPQCFSIFVPTTTQLLSKWGTNGHRRNKKKVKMQMYGNGDEEIHFLFLQSLINRLQHAHMHSHSRTRRNVHTISSCSSTKKKVYFILLH